MLKGPAFIRGAGLFIGRSAGPRVEGYFDPVAGAQLILAQIGRFLFRKEEQGKTLHLRVRPHQLANALGSISLCTAYGIMIKSVKWLETVAHFFGEQVCPRL
jgi:hypothetical protein